MKIALPEQVKKILEILEKHGYEGYAVGGCVRDSVLGRCPNDWDITTSALPHQVKELFSRTVDTGLQHGTVTVLMGGEGYEVTTYRVDGEYEDNRHPKEVTFTSNLIEDLKRRDFTINAMAYNESQGIVDAFGGIEDLEKGVIRCVGNPSERFDEDALRILRAIRFSAQLGFAIDSQTADAIQAFAPRLVNISAERIQTELVKMMISPHPEYLKKAWELGITAVIFPEFDRAMDTPQNNPHHCYTVGEHILKALQNIEAERSLRFSILLHDIGKPMVRSTDDKGIDHFYRHADESAKMAKRILRRLKFDNEIIRKVDINVRFHDVRPELTEKSVRKAVSRIGAENFEDILKVKRADTLAQNPAWQQEKMEYLKQLEELYHQILEKQQCLSIKELAVNGKDLIEDGMEQGKGIGEMLSKMLEYVLEYPQCNEKETLLAYGRRLRGQ